MSLQMEQTCVFCSIFSRSSTIQDAGNKSPEVCPSLIQQCFHLIAKDHSLLMPIQLRNLPVPLLEDLKFHLSSDSLISLSDVFEECGIETRLAWARLVHQRFGSKALAGCEVWISPILWKSPFKVAEDYHHPRQVYMARVCKQLPQITVETVEKSLKRDQIKGCDKENICKPCVTKVTSYLEYVTSFVLSWKQLSFILKADMPITNILKSLVGTLVDLEILFITFNDLDVVSNFLKQILKGKNLKSLALLYPVYRNGADMLKLLENLFLTDKASEVSMPVEEAQDVSMPVEEAKDVSLSVEGIDNEEIEDSEADDETLDLLDEALNSNKHNLSDLYWMNDTDAMVCIRNKIKCWERGGDVNNSFESLESLVFPLIDRSDTDTHRRLANLILVWKSIKRLYVENLGNYDCEDLLVMLGCRRLSHLRMGYIKTMSVMPLLFAVLFENYRSSYGTSKPLEYLGLHDVSYSESCKGPSLMHYDFDINAVRQLELVSCELNSSDTDNLVHFLSHNKSLSHLDLTDVHLTRFQQDRMEESPPLISILTAISKIRSLETLIVRNTEQMTGFQGQLLTAERHEEALLSLLQTQPYLKHLVLHDCGIGKQFDGEKLLPNRSYGQTVQTLIRQLLQELSDLGLHYLQKRKKLFTLVSSEGFLSTLKQHGSLEHLSLRNNQLGTAAVDLLLAISEPECLRALKGLSLESCDIPGKQLISTVRHIHSCLKGRLYLRYLNLNNNAVSLDELREIRQLLASSVTLLDIQGCAHRRESKLANFFEEEVE